MKYIVYQVTNKENGKLYIGVHKTENPDVFDGYIGNGICVGYSLENPKTAYQHALKKYGYKAFVRTTLKVFDKLEDALSYEAFLVTPEFVKQDNNYNTAVGGGYAIIYKTIYQFNNRKELVRTWEGNPSVAEFYGISKQVVNYAILHKKIILDSYFSYDESPIFEEFTTYRNELFEFSDTGDLLNTYKSTRDAAEKTGYNLKSIEAAATEKKIYKNHYWTRNPDDIYNIIKINHLYKLTYKPVILYNDKKEVIKEYRNMREAAAELNLSYDTIKQGARLGRLVNGMYYFSYTNVVTKATKIGQYENGELVKVWDTVAQCAKVHPKCREVLKGQRNQTHGYTFKYLEEDQVNDIV